MTDDNNTAASIPAVVVTRTFDAAPDRVFAAFTEADEIASSFGPENVTTEITAFEARAGAAFHFVMHHADGDDYPVGGTIVEINPPRHLVMTWIWEKGTYAGVETQLSLDYAGVETQLSLDFAPNDNGGTGLTLTHEYLADDEAHRLHDMGWTSAMAALGAHLGEG
jgi:uncharacterized protein YndB with AHSA1/START domain